MQFIIVLLYNVIIGIMIKKILQKKKKSEYINAKILLWIVTALGMCSYMLQIVLCFKHKFSLAICMDMIVLFVLIAVNSFVSHE